MTRDYANKTIRASAVMANLDTIVSKPETERQARPLSKIALEKQNEVWQEAVSTAPGGKVTARHVAARQSFKSSGFSMAAGGRCFA